MKKVFVICALIMVSACCSAQEAVDLGLSVKWGSMNIGASDPFEPGELFAWGELEPRNNKNEYTWEKYFDTDRITKRNSIYYVSFKTFKYGSYNSIKGHSSYDVAKKRLGGNWRMPTREEFRELLEKCTINMLYDKTKRISYFQVVGDNGNSIIIPFTGQGGYPLDDHTGCFLWSSSMNSSDDMKAYVAEFSRGYNTIMAIQELRRCYGAAVRPVYEYLNDSSEDIATRKWREAMKYIKAFNETANASEQFTYLKKADTILAELEKMPNVKLEKIRNKRKEIQSMMAQYEDL